MNIPEIHLASHEIFNIGGISLHNTTLAAFIVTGIIIVMGIFVRMNVKLVPGRFQLCMEMLMTFLLEKFSASWGSEERARKFLPILLTFFLFLVIANQFIALPLVSAVREGELEVLRTPTTDLSLTLAMALLVIFGSHLYGFIRHPLMHLGNFFRFHLLLKVRSGKDLFDAVLGIFLGLLEIISETSKVISLSCRLFGVIFGGEVVVLVMTGIFAYLLPIPFIGIAIFAAVIQAFVFCLLTINFMPSIVKSSEAGGHH